MLAATYQNEVSSGLEIERDDVVEVRALQAKLLFGSPFP
jgi:hypothetical protein